MSERDEWRWTDEHGVQRLVLGDELRAAIASNVLPPTTLVWREGMKAWTPAANVAELAGAAQAARRSTRPLRPLPRPPGKARDTAAVAGSTLSAPPRDGSVGPGADRAAGTEDRTTPTDVMTADQARAAVEGVASPSAQKEPARGGAEPLPGARAKTLRGLPPPPQATTAPSVGAAATAAKPPVHAPLALAEDAAPSVAEPFFDPEPETITRQMPFPRELASALRDEPAPAPAPAASADDAATTAPAPMKRASAHGGAAPAAAPSGAPVTDTGKTAVAPAKRPPPPPPRNATHTAPGVAQDGPVTRTAKAAAAPTKRPPPPPKKTGHELPREPAHGAAAARPDASRRSPTAAKPSIASAESLLQTMPGLPAPPPEPPPAAGKPDARAKPVAERPPARAEAPPPGAPEPADDDDNAEVATVRMPAPAAAREAIARLEASAREPSRAEGNGAGAAGSGSPSGGPPRETALTAATVGPAAEPGAGALRLPPRAVPASASPPPGPEPSAGAAATANGSAREAPEAALAGAPGFATVPPEASSDPAIDALGITPRTPVPTQAFPLVGPAAGFSSRARRRPTSMSDPVIVPVSSLVTAGAVLIVLVVAAFLVGRGSVAGGAAALSPGARTGLRAAARAARPSVSPAKPCWVVRQPAMWATRVARAVPFELAPAAAASLALGFARDDRRAVGLEIDAAGGEVRERFSAPAGAEIDRVVPVAGGTLRFAVSTTSDDGPLRHAVHAGSSRPFVVGVRAGAIVVADAPDAPASTLWTLEGDEPLEAVRLHGGEARGYALTFRRSGAIWGGWLTKDRRPAGPLSRVQGSGGSVGKPTSGATASEIGVVFADQPGGGSPWQIRVGRAPLGTLPTTTLVVPLPKGGPGGDAFAPAIAGLPDGRWLLMWTEGPAGSRAVRAQTLGPDFAPLGDPIALSPPAGNFGQGALGVTGTRVAAVFLSKGAASYELWGALLQCG